MRKDEAASPATIRRRARTSGTFASADEQRPDGQGRITLSPDHRSYARLSKECVVIGKFDHLEIWDAQTWEAYQAEHEEDFSSGIRCLRGPALDNRMSPVTAIVGETRPTPDRAPDALPSARSAIGRGTPVHPPAGPDE